MNTCKDLKEKLESLLKEKLSIEEKNSEKKIDPYFKPIVEPEYISTTKIEEEVFKSFNELYHKSVNENFFWEYCPFSAYQKTLEDRKTKFLDKFIDGTDSMFYKEELTQLTAKDNIWEYTILLETKRVKLFKTTELNNQSHPFHEVFKQVEFSESKKIEHIKYLLKEKGKLAPKQKEDPVLDLHSEIQNIRIVYLKELGILDYLQEKYPNISVNKLSSLISSFSGMEITTVQPYVNPIINTGNSQLNNPCTVKNEKLVKSKLIELGLEVEN